MNIEENVHPKYMVMKFIWNLIYVILSIGLLGACKSSEEPATTKPNIVLIITDDQGWGDFSINGNNVLETPAFDQFSKEGVTFNRFYVSPVCAPTRASLLTGRYNLRTGTTWVTHHKETMRSEEITIAEVLKENGYITGCFGKWHNGKQFPNNPNGQGFDEFIGFTDGHFNNYFDPVLEHNGGFIQTKGYITDVFTDFAMKFIEENKETPFFCYIPYNAPHGPFQVPDKYYDKYAERIDDPKTAAIYAMCDNIDDNVKRVLRLLDSLKLDKNTIVAFLTDNGPNGHRYNGGMKGIKGHVDEGGIRVPLFLRYPGVTTPGVVFEDITAHIDMMPTLLELCGLSLPEKRMIDGISLVPLLRGYKVHNDRMIFTQYSGASVTPENGSVRTDKYRFTVHKNGDTALYDMIADPNQRLDISDVRPDIVSLLADAYNKWFEEVTSTTEEEINISMGYKDFPVTILPAPDARLEGNLSFEGGYGWANDWIIDFKTEEDEVIWPVNVIETGKYSFKVHYASSDETIGSVVKIVTNNKEISQKITSVESAPVVPSPDRIPRGEVYERKWGTLDVGESTLEKGMHEIRLSVSGNPDGFEMKELIVTFQ